METLALGALSPYPPGRQRPAMNREEPHLGLDPDRGVVRPEGPTQSELLTVRARFAAAEQRLRVALEAGNVGSWEYDPKSGGFCCDAKFKSFFGFAPNETPTAPDISARIHPDDREQVREAVARALAGVNGGEYLCEYRVTAPLDPIERWVSARGRTFFDESGAATRFLGAAIDVTRDRIALERTSFLAKAGAL